MADYEPPTKRRRSSEGHSKRWLEDFKTRYRSDEVSPEEEVEFLSNLGERYKRKGQLGVHDSWLDLLKAHTLFNTCALKDKDNTERWLRDAYHVQTIFWSQYQQRTKSITVNSTFDVQQAVIIDLKLELKKIREETQSDLQVVKTLIDRLDCNHDTLDSTHNKEIVRQFSENMRNVSRACNSKMQKFTRNVMRHAFAICGEEQLCPCAFEVLVIGSMAKGECTPYSDLEYLFLVEKSGHMDYFVLLAVTSYFLIGSLQETRLAHMDLQELSDGWYQDRNPAGFQIDGITLVSGNIPTGGGHVKQHNNFIKTVDEMVEYYRGVYDNPPEDAYRGDDSAMLVNTAVVFRTGDQDLHSKLKRSLQVIKPTEERVNATRSMFESDVERYNFLPDENFDLIVDIKRQIYRYPSIMIHNLKVYFQAEFYIDASDSFDITMDLLNRGKISKDFYQALLFVLYSAQYIRLETYQNFKSQKGTVSFLSATEMELLDNCKDAFSPHYTSKKLVLHMFIYLIPVKLLLKTFLKDPSVIEGGLKSFDPLESAALVHYYRSEFEEFLQCVEKMTIKKDEKDMPIQRKLMTLEALRRAGHFEEVLLKIKDTDMTQIKDKKQVGAFRMFEAHCDYELSRFLEANEKYNKAQEYFTTDCMAERARCYRGSGHAQLKLGDFEKSQACFEKEHEIFINLKRQKETEYRAPCYHYDIDIAGCLVNIGICLESAGMYSAAEDNYIDARDEYWKLRGPDTHHREASMIHINLGNLKMLTRKLHEASRYYKRALEIDKALYSSGVHADIARDYNNLGVVHVSLNSYNEAKDYFTKSLDILLKLHPNEPLVDIACRRRNLATVHLRLGDYDEAKQLYERSLGMYNEIYRGAPHSDIADIYTGLAKLLYSTNDKVGAGQNYEKALEMYREVYKHGQPHPKVAMAYNNACYHYLQLKNFQKAEDYAKKSLLLFQQIDKGKSCSLDVANCYDTLAEVFETSGDTEKATQNYKLSIEAYEEVLGGKPDYELARSYMKLGALLQKKGQTDPCTELYNKSLDMYEEMFPDRPDHPDIKTVRSRLESLKP